MALNRSNNSNLEQLAVHGLTHIHSKQSPQYDMYSNHICIVCTVTHIALAT